MEIAVIWLPLLLCTASNNALLAGLPDKMAEDSDRYSLPPSVSLKDGDTFEYIVVGAGAAGSAVAARLALAGRDVLLVEAGGDPGYISRVPGASLGLLGSALDWQYKTISNNISCLSYQGQQCRFSRGRCLGGSTSINDMIYTRGTPHDFDQLDIPGWYWKDIRPYFLRFEGLKDLSSLPPSSIPYHNTTGPMSVEFFTDSRNPWHSKIVQGYQDLNIPFNPDVNAESQIGVTQVIGYVYKNERMSTARGYLGRDDVKKKLKVAKLTRCTGVIIDDQNMTRGITVVHGLLKTKLKIYSGKEVILSAGAIATPQILMLSGIGPAKHLKKFGIPVKADLPVGDDMTDHVLPLVFVKVDRGEGIADDLLDASTRAVQLAELLLRGNGPLASIGLTDVTTFLNMDCYDFDKRQLRNDSKKCDLPTLQFIHAYIDRNIVALAPHLVQQGTGLNDNIIKQLAAISKEYGFIVKSPLLLQPKSRGTVRLASSDPLEPPAILPNFLSDENDVEDMVKALTILEHLMETPPFKRQNASIVLLEIEDCPAYATNAQEYWRCYSRYMTHTTFHSVGTTALGRVVDGQLRVRGVRGLRVGDAGVLPRLPRANTAAAVIALGERLAQFILDEQDLK